LDQPEHPKPDFNLAAMSLADLRELQKSVVKAISTFAARQLPEARDKVEMLAKDLGFTLAELAELEEPKRKRAPSTKIYRHPDNPTSPGPDGVANRAGSLPMSMQARTRANSSAGPEDRCAAPPCSRLADISIEGSPKPRLQLGLELCICPQSSAPFGFLTPPCAS
jgi:DNA-binding protein H-NS